MKLWGAWFQLAGMGGRLRSSTGISGLVVVFVSACSMVGRLGRISRASTRCITADPIPPPFF